MEKFWEDYGVTILWIIIGILVVWNVWKMWGKNIMGMIGRKKAETKLPGAGNGGVDNATKRLIGNRQPAQQLARRYI